MTRDTLMRLNPSVQIFITASGTGRPEGPKAWNIYERITAGSFVIEAEQNQRCYGSQQQIRYDHTDVREDG